MAAREGLRDRVAGLIGCDAGEVALTGSTTDGVNTVAVARSTWAPSDEIVTTDRSTPACSPRSRARRGDGRAASASCPGTELADAVGARDDARRRARTSRGSTAGWSTPTRWREPAPRSSGRRAGPRAPCRSTCARSAATSTRRRGRSGCAAPTRAATCTCAASAAQELDAPWPGYMTLAEPGDALAFDQHETARALRHGHVAERRRPPGRPPPSTCWRSPGSTQLHERAIGLAARLADLLAERGREVAPRGATTLVSWSSGRRRGRRRAAGRRRHRRPRSARPRSGPRLGRRLGDRGRARAAGGRGVIPDPNSRPPPPHTDRVVFLKPRRSTRRRSRSATTRTTTTRATRRRSQKQQRAVRLRAGAARDRPLLRAGRGRAVRDGRARTTRCRPVDVPVRDLRRRLGRRRWTS